MTSRAAQRHPEVTVRCSWCLAQPDASCTTPRGELRQKPHPGRRDDWATRHADCSDCSATAGTPCMNGDGRPTQVVHPARAQAATALYAEAVEAASRDIRGGQR
jgi:hypothetical protein